MYHPHSESDAAREQRARRSVARLGYLLRKSRRRNPESPDYGLFHIVEPNRNWIVIGARPWDYSLDLDDVEAWLAEVPAATESRPDLGGMRPLPPDLVWLEEGDDK